MEEIRYPKIRKRAAEEGASIFFADEASIRTDHHAGTTWAPVGQTPVVITTGERKSVNMVSAISPRGTELRFIVAIQPGWLGVREPGSGAGGVGAVGLVSGVL